MGKQKISDKNSTPAPQIKEGIRPKLPEDEVDIASADSFPASDPPGWIRRGESKE